MAHLVMLALTFDISLNQLLEKGIAVFFAVVLLIRLEKRMKALEAATNSQTLMFHDCLVWLGELIRRDKKVDPPTTPGMQGHLHKRATDTDSPTPFPPSKPLGGIK